MTRTRSVSEGNLLALRGFSRPHLQRPAHSSGLAAFVAAMQQGTTDQQVIADILGSQEYFGCSEDYDLQLAHCASRKPKQ